MSAPLGSVVHGTPWMFAQNEHQHPSRNWHDCCQMFTRMAFDVPSDGAATAADAWAQAKLKHPETNPLNIPRGVAVYWLGGSSGAGHAAVSRGDGTVWGTDLVRDGQVDVYPIADVHAKWGLTLVGWTEDVDGVRVWQPAVAPQPKPANPGSNVIAARKALRKAKARAKNPARLAALKAALAAIRKLFP